jgi:putative SOS response-associated peptidase YedK
MCGRFTITLKPAEYQELLDLGDFGNLTEGLIPRYNVAPTQPVAVSRDFANHQVEWMRWGLIPGWAKDMSIGVRMINARCETLLEKPSFRETFLKRHCLILADGFYEWQKFPGKLASIPHYFYLQPKQPFFFAGLWDQWHSPSGENILSCTIITGEPNALVSPVHERMPIILDHSNAWEWLNPAATPASLQAFFQPYPAEAMAEHAVSSLVNQAGLELPNLIDVI